MGAASLTFRSLAQAKGRFLKHSGDLVAAAEALEMGRKLDLADKWINSKSSKFQLRAGLIERGESVVSLFTKHEGDSRGYLTDMQTMWFETEAGGAYLRAGEVAMALKLFKAVEKHFDDFEDDQIDFHAYCLRKFTLRAYVSLLRLEDRLRGHAFFTGAAAGAVRCYLLLADLRSHYSSKSEGAAELDYTGMSAAERKKAKTKARKLELRKEKAAAERAEREAERKKQLEAAQKLADKEEEEAESADGAGGKKRPARRRRDIPVDMDPDGAKLLEDASKDPLGAAHALLKTVRRFAPGNLQTHLDAFDVEVRRGKYLQAMRALVAAAELCHRETRPALGAMHPELLARLPPFLALVAAGKVRYAPWAGKATCLADVNKPVDHAVKLSPVAKEVIAEAAAALCAGAPDLLKDPLAALKQAHAALHAGVDIARCRAASRALLTIDPADKAPLAATVAAVERAVAQQPNDAKLRFAQLDRVREALAEMDAPQPLRERYDAVLKAVFARASTLGNPTPYAAAETKAMQGLDD